MIIRPYNLNAMLKDRINEDFKTAFKQKEVTRLSVLKMLKAAILNKEKDKEYQFNKQGKPFDAAGGGGAALTDEEILEVIASEVKKLRDALALFIQGGRTDLADKTKEEIEILLQYLPEQLNEDEIKKLVAEAIADAGATTIKDMGKVMAVLMPKVKGRADNAMVGRFVKEALS
jgi:uncharacterized protein YqeY